MSLVRCRHCRRPTSRLGDACYFCDRPLRRSTRGLRLALHAAWLLALAALAARGMEWFLAGLGDAAFLFAAQLGAVVAVLGLDGVARWWAAALRARRRAALDPSAALWYT